MPEEEAPPEATTAPQEPPKAPAPPGDAGAVPVSSVGAEFARTRDIVILAGVLLLLAFAFGAILLQAWPPAPPPAGSAAAAQEHATRMRILFWRLGLLRDVRLFVVVTAAGGMGALVHVLRSLYEYVGNQSLRRRWLLMYVLEPYIGALMALVFYFVLRGGLTTTTASSNDINPYGVTALAALVGMFSREAVQKLNDVFKTVFTSAGKSADHIPTPAGGSSDPGPDR